MSGSTAVVEGGLSSQVSAPWAGPWASGQLMSLEVGRAWREEALRFAGRRFSHNQDAIIRLTRCVGLQDLLQLQMDWAREAVEDYLQESHSLLGIAADVDGREENTGEANGHEDTMHDEPEPQRAAEPLVEEPKPID